MGFFSNKKPNFRQTGAMDCGPTCLKIVGAYFGRNFSNLVLREKCKINKNGVSLFAISEAAESIGLASTGAKIDFEGLINEKPFPSIINWGGNHFVVLLNVKKNRVTISDPAMGIMYYSREEFMAKWSNHEATSLILYLEPTSSFYEEEEDAEITERDTLFSFSINYARPYYKYFIQLFLGMLLGSVTTYFIPFLSQAIIDKGVMTLDLNFVQVVILIQLVIFLFMYLTELLRVFIMLYLSGRTQIGLFQEFVQKLLDLKVSFFSTHLTTDIARRMEDLNKIDSILIEGSVTFLMAVINIAIYSVIILSFSPLIFMLFVCGSGLAMLVTYWMNNQVKKLDTKYFEQYGKTYNFLFEIINGVKELRNYNSVKLMRWKWQQKQSRLHKISIKQYSANVYSNNYSQFIRDATTLSITFVTAKLVIDGDISLGTMFAINLVVAQMRGPVDTITSIIPKYQAAKLGLARVLEVLRDEPEKSLSTEIETSNVNYTGDIVFEGVGFSYYNDPNSLILKDANFIIPGGKTTAIVGPSGSGKSTIMNLLLRYYEPTYGKIKIDETSFSQIPHENYRDNIGVVLQEGKVFSDSIINNIALGDPEPNLKKVIESATLACISEFIEENLPTSYNTVIGDEGQPLSFGQKQRILLARAFYKMPDILFLDEATSALDAENERKVMDNIYSKFKNKTIIAIAHRLSTVINADQILVLHKGNIAECGTHKELVKMRGIYYNLVKNQLEVD